MSHRGHWRQRHKKPPLVTAGEGLKILQAHDRGHGARSCSVCGCTSRWRCAGGCTWAGPSLCTRCGRRLAPGVYDLERSHELYLDLPELFEANGYADTPENRATVEAAARAKAAELGITVVES